MQGFYSRRNCWGTHRIYRETVEFDKIVKNVFNEVVIDGKETSLAIFAYGSPGRLEMAGGDSDADIFIAEPSKTPERENLKESLKKGWESFDFSKVDIPPWGTYDEIDDFLRYSLVEGNQILETRFICGNDQVRKEVEEKKLRFDSPNRELENMVFNKLYFNQYFNQRVREGARNIKYCNGGTRDFLFFYWYDRLCKKIGGENDSLSGLNQPKVKEGLERLMMEGSISGEKFGKVMDAVNGITELRTDSLIVNRATQDRGLSVLDDNLISRLQRDLGYPSGEKIRNFFNYATSTIDETVNVIWDKTLEIGSNFYGNLWKDNLNLACSINTPSKKRLNIPDYDNTTRIALLWGASNSGNTETFDTLVRRYWGSVEWGTLASIVCSPLCSQRVLHDIGTGIAKEKGYGYILRIVGRNKNTSEETLKNIAEDSSLEPRYTEVARNALEKGNNSANNLI